MQCSVGVTHFVVHMQAFCSALDKRGHKSGYPLRLGSAKNLCDIFRDILLGHNACTNGIVDIVIYIGDNVCKSHNIALFRVGYHVSVL